MQQCEERYRFEETVFKVRDFLFAVDAKVEQRRQDDFDTQRFRFQQIVRGEVLDPHTLQ